MRVGDVCKKITGTTKLNCRTKNIYYYYYTHIPRMGEAKDVHMVLVGET
jgi:hypothetical protein